MSAHSTDMERVKAAVQTLMEHFDTVQIFASRYEIESERNGETTEIAYGDGNWFARFGQVKEWIVCTEQRSRNSVESRT